jgi:mono/diheme cytochrome c family protein
MRFRFFHRGLHRWGVWGCLALWPLIAAAGEKVHAVQHTTTGRQVVLRPDAPSVSVVASVRSLYVLHCAGCHGIDGSGAYGAQVPGLRQMGSFLRLRGGREYLVQVPGMMGSGLSDAQVAQLANWLLAQWGGGALPPGHRPYDGEEVARLRGHSLLDVAATRAQLVQQARAQGVPLADLP